jgi:hypothetical protein
MVECESNSEVLLVERVEVRPGRQDGICNGMVGLR